MISKPVYQEAFAIASRMMKALIAFPAKGSDGAMMRNVVGKFLADLYENIDAGIVGTELLACFDQAWKGGATVKSMDGVREQALSETPRHLISDAITNAGIIFSFVEQSRIIVAMTFASREQVDQMMDAIGAAVEEVKLAKSNSFTSQDYQNYVALSASLFQHLSATERQLPRIVPYHLAAHLPSLTISNRIYGDGSRSDELIAENRTVHPAFMQRDIVALSE